MILLLYSSGILFAMCYYVFKKEKTLLMLHKKMILH